MLLLNSLLPDVLQQHSTNAAFLLRCQQKNITGKNLSFATNANKLAEQNATVDAVDNQSKQ